MQKQRPARRKSRKIPFDPLSFLQSVIQDLADGLGPDLVAKLSTSLVTSDLPSFRSLVESETCLAETCLAQGGFDRYVSLRQLEAFFTKNVSVGGCDTRTRKQTALGKFWNSELACKRANKRIRHYRFRMSRLGIVGEVLNSASLLIQEILGELTSEVQSEMMDMSDHGPGATFISSDDPDTKLMAVKLSPSYSHSVTKECLPYFIAYGRRNPHWVNYLCVMDASYKVVKGNRVTTVPKKWDRDRTIGVEPSLNVFLQKGVGDYIAQRLRRCGVTLDDQRPNQYVAREASVFGHLATVDLSAASDTLAVEAVRMLIPGAWYDLLDALRSKEFVLNPKSEEWFTYEKFSSMGNGFTFPLESLIFYAVARVCSSMTQGSDTVRVFGDDIVTDVQSVPLLVEVLAFLGFKVNVEKTFVFGPFRETCGCDYVYGIDVRPVYVESWPTSEPDLYNLHNRLRVHPCMPMLTTVQYLTTLIKNPAVIPPSLGLRLTGKWKPGMTIPYQGGFVEDLPPEPDGYCSSYQSDYWIYTELTFREKSVTNIHWYARYLAFLKGLVGGEVQSASRKQYFRVTRFVLQRRTVSEIRDWNHKKRTRSPHG